MTKKNLMPAIVLSAICIVSALLLSVINIFTGPRIAANKEANANKSLVEVYPGGTGFTKLDLSKYELPASITAAYSEASGGFVIQSTVTGWKPGLVIMCGIDKDGTVVGADYIASNETLGAENGLGDRFIGKGKSDMTPDIVAGPTAKMTTGAYYNAIKDALEAYNILKGGKTLAQSLNAALGTEGVEFDKWLAVATVEGIDAVYTAKDNSGRVYVIGEEFIGIKADGTVGPTEASAENQSKAIAADDIIKVITYESVSKPAGTKANVVSIKKASNGAYVFNLLADGFDAVYYGAPIEISVAISQEGKIVDIVTTYQNESGGYGDVCATEEYYEQYRGKGDGDVKLSASGYPESETDDLIPDGCTDVGAISNATYTTYGYQTAIKAAFTAFNKLTEGGNE